MWLCRATRYDASEALLREFFRKKYCPPPKPNPVTNEPGWSEFGICLLIQSLHEYRRWIPNHPYHVAEYWAIEVAQWHAEEQGGRVFTDLGNFTVEKLALLLADDGWNSHQRQLLATALKAKLPHEFGPTRQDQR